MGSEAAVSCKILLEKLVPRLRFRGDTRYVRLSLSPPLPKHTYFVIYNVHSVIKGP